MRNSEIYRRTLKFALMRMLCTIVGIVFLIALPIVGVVAFAGMGEVAAVIAAIVGLILGIVVMVVIGRYAGYLFRAGQIAMIAQGVAEGQLPADAYAAGKQAVKERFGTASVYFALMAITRAISNEITTGLNAVAGAVGGAANNNNPAAAAASIASAIISIVLEYLNYCSLGWVFLHRDQNAFKSTCDGAVIYFQNWKTLLKNAGKVLALTAVSLLVIGGAFFGLFYLILGSIGPLTSVLADLDAAATLDDGSPVPAGTCLIILCVIVALVFWGGVHGAFIEPYILVSVMRRYVEAGYANPPKVDLYGKLAGMSKGFRKALDKAGDNARGGEGASA